MDKEVLLFVRMGNDQECLMLKRELTKVQDIHQFRLRVVYNDKLNMPLFQQYGVRALPTTLVIDANGYPLDGYVGSELCVGIEPFLERAGVIRQ